MAIRIEPLVEELCPAVRALNRRLIEGGETEFLFPEHPKLEWLPYGDNERLYQRPFVAIDDDGFVRGGYVLKKQDFLIGGECRSIGFARLVLSEGIVNRAYSSLGPTLVLHALKQSPMLYCLGMGGMDQPLPRLLAALRWKLEPVPFFFYVVHGAKFLAGMPALRKHGLKSLAAKTAALTGLGHAGVRIVQAARTRTKRRESEAMSVPEFGTEVNGVWAHSHNGYRLAAVRDTDTVRTLYGGPSNLFHRLEVKDREVVGWAVMLDTRMKDSRHFGDLRVGSIVDCDALPGRAAEVALAARDYLEQRSVDVIVTNQMHSIWRTAFSAAGFLNFPSNYIFAASKNLSAAILEFGGCHLTRGDGDGPIHL